jgi:hypothetical protein
MLGKKPQARQVHRPATFASFEWSGRPGSNRRHPAWEAGVLPLNYSRSRTATRLEILHFVQDFASGLPASPALRFTPAERLNYSRSRTTTDLGSLQPDLRSFTSFRISPADSQRRLRSASRPLNGPTTPAQLLNGPRLSPLLSCKQPSATVSPLGRAVAGALQHAKVFAPRTHGLPVLVSHNPRNLTQMS